MSMMRSPATVPPAFFSGSSRVAAPRATETAHAFD
jgi:hypothetical protein